jgi:hypothetical protein
MLEISAMAKVRKRRPFLIGMLAGASMVIGSSGVASLLNKKPAIQYLRVIDDNGEKVSAIKRSPEHGPLSARLIRNCKIQQFVTDTEQLDYAGSSFVKIDGMAKSNLNCLIGEARIHSLSIAIVDGIDTTPADCIEGWPTRAQKVASGGFELCPEQQNPNPIFISPQISLPHTTKLNRN